MDEMQMGAEFRILSLRCDAEGCDYIEPSTVNTEEEVLATIGKVCPKCGANLLTQSDADKTISHMRMMRNLDALLKSLPMPEGESSMRVKVNLQGTQNGGLEVNELSFTKIAGAGHGGGKK